MFSLRSFLVFLGGAGSAWLASQALPRRREPLAPSRRPAVSTDSPDSPSPAGFPPALLEDWMRDYYFSTDIDIGSSGVEDFSMLDLRRLLGFSYDEIDGIAFHDSRTLGGPGLRAAIAERWTNGEVERVMATH